MFRNFSSIWNAKKNSKLIKLSPIYFSDKFLSQFFSQHLINFFFHLFKKRIWFSFWIQILFENHKLIKSIFESGKTHKNLKIIFSIRNSTTRKLSVSIFLVFQFKQTRNLIYSKQFLIFRLVCEILCCKLFDYSLSWMKTRVFTYSIEMF